MFWNLLKKVGDLLLALVGTVLEKEENFGLR